MKARKLALLICFTIMMVSAASAEIKQITMQVEGMT